MKRQEVAKFLKVGESTVYRLIEQGALVQEGKEITRESIDKLTGNAKTVHKITEIADILGVADNTVLRWISQGKFKTFKIGSQGVRVADWDGRDYSKRARKKDLSDELPKEPPREKAKTEYTALKRIQIEDIEIKISMTKPETTRQKLIGNFVKAWLDGKDLEKKLDDLLGLIE